MPDGVSARTSEYIKYIKKLNAALYAVAYGSEAIIVTFEPQVMILHGPRAEAVANNLLQTGKIQCVIQIAKRGRYAKRAYIADMQNEHASQSFAISVNKTTDLKCGHLIKILDMQGNTIEYAYLLKDPVKSDGVFKINIKTQNGETVCMAVTNAIQKI